jgi:hypothetical protein
MLMSLVNRSGVIVMNGRHGKARQTNGKFMDGGNSGDSRMLVPVLV